MRLTFGRVSSCQVRDEASSQPLKQFLLKFPGLTRFIGRILLSYFDNTTPLEQVAKRKRKSDADEESISECDRKRQREDTV